MLQGARSGLLRHRQSALIASAPLRFTEVVHYLTSMPAARAAPVRRAPKIVEDFAPTDYGNTIRLGAYEASADGILYEFDPEYRRRAKQRELHQDESFGAALRRLRLARGLSRDDFPGISGRTIARIERGEVERPREGTLHQIAQRLGVAPEEISTY